MHPLHHAPPHRGHACSVLSMEPISSFYRTTISKYYNLSMADRGATPSTDSPCRFIIYPDTLPGGAQQQLQATLSGKKTW